MNIENKKNDATENLKDGYEQIKIIYQIQSERLKTSDEKLNMLLVFNAAIIALIIVVIPFPNSGVRNILSIILFSIFTVSIFLTVICIFIRAIPQKVRFHRLKKLY